MSHLIYITGAAGTGKTYTLSDELIKWFETNALSEDQSVLAITKMHGSRKRLRERLTSKSITGRLTISTVDSFALEVVNRCRLSLGYSSAIVPIKSEEVGGFKRDELGYRATFEEIRKSAADLTRSPIVVKIIANTYPIILVDEFQDCTDNQLLLIKNLFGYVDLILAADPFQALNGDESACEWLSELEGQESVRVERLTQDRRSNCSYLHAAANALLYNQPAIYDGQRLPFIQVPSYPYAAWKIIPHIPLTSTAALIYPVHKVLTQLNKTVASQNSKRAAENKQLLSFPWITQISDDELSNQIYVEFVEAVRQDIWKEDKKWRRLYEQSLSLSKAKGYSTPQDIFIKHTITSSVQARKFTLSRPIRFEATTIHGAKNREFDHVFVFWDDNLCTKYDDEQKRRLLYNAITRAKLSCTIIAIGSDTKIAGCPVLSLVR